MLESAESTNTYLIDNREIYGDGTAVLTLNQTAGRGRGDHSWLGGGLAVSVLLKQRGYFSVLLPLAVAVASASAVEQLTGYESQIKWPNDIIMGGKKICGILCEGKPAKNGQTAAICGAGFNLLQEAECFEKAGLPNAASVFAQTGMKLGYRETAECYLGKLGEAVFACTENPRSLLDEYRRRCMTIGKEVRVLPQNFTGIAAGISDKGALLVETKDGVTEVYGEASVRGINGYI